MEEINNRLVPEGLTCFENSQFALFPTAGMSVTGTVRAGEIPTWLQENEGYKTALRVEVRFLQNQGVEIPWADEVTSCGEVHQRFVEDRLGQVGLRNISVVNGQVQVKTVTVVPYPLYRAFNRSAQQAEQEQAANLGVCMILVTADNKLVVQERGKKNRIYGGNIPGASAAGLVSARHLPPLGAGEVEVDLIAIALKNACDESLEEIGVKPDNLSFVGIALDKWAIHHELVFLGRFGMTFAELTLKARAASDVGQTLLSFKENFFGVKATAENLEKLASMSSPMPPTHSAGFAMQYAALGGDLGRYVQVLEKSGNCINSLCRGGAYNPNVSAADQGLPSVHSEFVSKFGEDGFDYVKVV